jgi:hypothetical protein
VYLGPSRTFDDDDLQYLNGDIPEEEEVKLDSYRQELIVKYRPTTIVKTTSITQKNY